jgi:DNA-binding XRE family transcriptional regulator
MYGAISRQTLTPHIIQSTGRTFKGTFKRPPIYATMEDNKRSSSSMELRRKAGLNRTQVALVLGVAERTLAKWEQGTQEPHLPPWKIKLWAQLYQCSTDDLLSAFPAPQENELVKQINMIYDHIQSPTPS